MIHYRYGQHVAGTACWLLAACLLGQPAVGQLPVPHQAPAGMRPFGSGAAAMTQGGSPMQAAGTPGEIVQSSGRPGNGGQGSRRLLIRLPGTESEVRGQVMVRPRVEVVGPSSPVGERGARPGMPQLSSSASGFAAGQIPYVAQGATPEVLPPPTGDPYGMSPEVLPGEMILGEGPVPMFDELVADTAPQYAGRHGFLSRWLGPRLSPYEDRGLGYERVMMAPMELDITQPQNNIRLRLDNAYGFEHPDRAEFFWAKIGGRGPNPDNVLELDDDATLVANEQVNYQDIRFMFEVGGPRLSVQTEVPIRFIDPQDLFLNTAGLGDMSVKTKLLMLDGRRWQITQYFGTYFPTGAPGHGTGTGHTSIEPGFLFRYMWNDAVYWHGEIKYWVPLGGDPDHSGQIFRWGTGISYLWYESDTLAVIPMLELVSWTVLDGQKTGTIFGAGGAFDFDALEVDGETTVNLYPGLRISYDGAGDLGLFEFGIQGGFTVTETYWYSGMLRLEARFVY